MNKNLTIKEIKEMEIVELKTSELLSQGRSNRIKSIEEITGEILRGLKIDKNTIL